MPFFSMSSIFSLAATVSLSKHRSRIFDHLLAYDADPDDDCFVNIDAFAKVLQIAWHLHLIEPKRLLTQAKPYIEELYLCDFLQLMEFLLEV